MPNTTTQAPSTTMIVLNRKFDTALYTVTTEFVAQASESAWFEENFEIVGTAWGTYEAARNDEISALEGWME